MLGEAAGGGARSSPGLFSSQITVEIHGQPRSQTHTQRRSSHHFHLLFSNIGTDHCSRLMNDNDAFRRPFHRITFSRETLTFVSSSSSHPPLRPQNGNRSHLLHFY